MVIYCRNPSWIFVCLCVNICPAVSAKISFWPCADCNKNRKLHAYNRMTFSTRVDWFGRIIDVGFHEAGVVIYGVLSYGLVVVPGRQPLYFRCLCSANKDPDVWRGIRFICKQNDDPQLTSGLQNAVFWKKIINYKMWTSRISPGNKHFNNWI